MKKYYFLDDWVLDGYRDMHRVFSKPLFVGYIQPDEYLNPNCIIKDRKSGWYLNWTETEAFVNGCKYILSFSKSEDGVHWQKSGHTGEVDQRFPERFDSISFERKLGYSIYYDERDGDAERRYKSVAYDGVLMTSPDGFQWKTNENMRCFRLEGSYSDSINNILWNPVTNNYQVTCRDTMADRRITLVQSADLVNWSKPIVVLHPDAIDPPLAQFYDLYQYWTGDIFIGFLQVFCVPHEERRWEHKMYGFTQSELVYSYNGLNWIRPKRCPFFEHPEPPALGSNSIYGSNIIDEGDHYRVYSTGTAMHCSGQEYEEYAKRKKQYSATLIHSIRKDGFACMETIGGWGILWTKSITPLDGDFTINFKANDVNSQMCVQLLGEDWKPIPGFTFEDCIPLSGDDISAKPRWKSRDPSELKGRTCKIEFKIYNARIYSFSWNSEIKYGPSLDKGTIEMVVNRVGKIVMRPDEKDS